MAHRRGHDYGKYNGNSYNGIDNRIVQQPARKKRPKSLFSKAPVQDASAAVAASAAAAAPVAHAPVARAPAATPRAAAPRAAAPRAAAPQGRGMLKLAEEYLDRLEKKENNTVTHIKPVVTSSFFPRQTVQQSKTGESPMALFIKAFRITLVFFLAGAVLLGGFALFARDRLIPSPIVPPVDEGFAEDLAAYVGIAKTEEASGDEFPLDIMETFAWKEYTIQPGDTIDGIAKNFSLSYDAIIASNNIDHAKLIQPGKVLRIPNMDGIPYTVKKGDTLEKISSAQGVPMEAILDANDMRSEVINPGAVVFIPGAKMQREDLRKALGEYFMYPLRGRLTSGFGWRNDPISHVRLFHNGLDLAAPMGATVRAAMDGRVSSTGTNAVYGKFVIITHADKLQTMYGHLSRISVKRGDSVLQGAKIGEVGSTGRSTGPHLHFSVYQNSRAINPIGLLNK